MNASRQLAAEMTFAEMLKRMDIFNDDTTTLERREAFRAVLTDGLADKTLGRNTAGKLETYQDVFERIYEYPLYPEQERAVP